MASAGSAKGGATLEEACKAIQAMHRPLAIGHVMPDADCLGSMLAFARAWDAPVAACLPRNSVSRRLQFLIDWAEVPVAESPLVLDSDGYVVVDTARQDRCNVGSAASSNWSQGKPIVVIDHHVGNDRFGQVSCVVTDASSNAELIYRCLRHAGCPIDHITASLLYAGVHADTRGFTVGIDCAASLAIAAELAGAGARVCEVGTQLCRNHSQEEFDLARLIYRNTSVIAQGKIAYSTADWSEIADCGCKPADIDEQVQIPQSLKGAALALLFTEGQKGRVRVNIRAQLGYSALELAEQVGGGGHLRAAGAVLAGDIAAALDRVLPLAEELLRNGRATAHANVAGQRP